MTQGESPMSFGRQGRGRNYGRGSRNRLNDINQLIQLFFSLQILFGSRRGGTGALVLILVLGIGGYLAFQFWFDPNRALASADRLWDSRDSANRISAIRKYKELLAKRDPVDPDFPWLKDGRPRLYRRIIEHEVLYRERSEARDWILEAWNERIVELNFGSEEARQVWQEVTKDLPIPRGRSFFHDPVP